MEKFRNVCRVVVSIAFAALTCSGCVAMKKDVEQLSKQCDAIKDEMRNEIQASSSRSSHDLKEGLNQVSKDYKGCIARALQAEYEIKSNSAYAKEALKLAESAIARRNYDLAKVYLLKMHTLLLFLFLHIIQAILLQLVLNLLLLFSLY